MRTGNSYTHSTRQPDVEYIVGLISDSAIDGADNLNSATIKQSVTGYIKMTSEEIDQLDQMCVHDFDKYGTLERYSNMANSYRLIGMVNGETVTHLDHIATETTDKKGRTVHGKLDCPSLLDRYTVTARQSRVADWDITTDQAALEDMLFSLWCDETYYDELMPSLKPANKSSSVTL